jgi:hypothetical protein
MKPEQRALRACTDYARLSGEIKRLTRLLSDSLARCPGVNGHLQYLDIGYDQAALDRFNADETHLKRAYAVDTDEDGSYWLNRSEQLEILSACPHCLAADTAIQDRKAARKSLGAAKRAITMIGRAAAQQHIKAGA